MHTGSINSEYSVNFNNSNLDRQSYNRARRDTIKQRIQDNEQIPELPEDQEESQDTIMPLEMKSNNRSSL